MDPFKAYTYTGNFDAELFYITVYGKIPNKFCYSPADSMECNVAEIKLDYVKDMFHRIDGIRQYSELSEEDPSEALIFEHEEGEIKLKSKRGSIITIAADNRVFYIKCDDIKVFYGADDNLEIITNLAKEMFERFPKKGKEETWAKVKLIKVYQGDYFTSTKDIKPTNINIDENYNDDFKKVYEDTVNFLNERASGLILYQGTAGTGKTTLIRHLISNVPKEYIIVPNSVASRLGDPDLVSFITDNTDSVFILEDCEQLLEDRGENPFNNAITTILNMADGLLSDICNIKFICTFNAPISKIDPALLRKGRCVARYEFGKLSEDKVKLLNEKYNLGHEKIEAMTLADLYNADKTDYSDEEEDLKIGF